MPDIHALDRDLLEDQGVGVVAGRIFGEIVFDLDLGVALAEGRKTGRAFGRVIGRGLPRNAIAQRRLLVRIFFGVGVVLGLRVGDGLGEIGGEDAIEQSLVV